MYHDKHMYWQFVIECISNIETVWCTFTYTVHSTEILKMHIALKIEWQTLAIWYLGIEGRSWESGLRFNSNCLRAASVGRQLICTSFWTYFPWKKFLEMVSRNLGQYHKNMSTDIWKKSALTSHSFGKTVPKRPPKRP